MKALKWLNFGDLSHSRPGSFPLQVWLAGESGPRLDIPDIWWSVWQADSVVVLDCIYILDTIFPEEVKKGHFQDVICWNGSEKIC
jgi:hypothetical protein